MRTTALVLITAIALGASSVRAEEPAPKQRGFLSGLGLGLLVVGMGGVGAGVAGVVSANDAYSRLGAYSGAVTTD